MRKFLCLSLLSLFSVSCGNPSSSKKSSHDQRDHSVVFDEGYVKSQAFIDLDMSEQVAQFASKKVPIEIINPPNVSFTVDTEKFMIPKVSNSLLDFGKLEVTELFDNDIHICGSSKKTKCKSAFIRIYTTGTPGAGLWNNDYGYGMPITGNLEEKKPSVIGLEAKSAAIIKKINIGKNTNVVRLSDFNLTSLLYEIHSDFTNAGTGAYSTTLVIEYGLMD